MYRVQYVLCRPLEMDGTVDSLCCTHYTFWQYHQLSTVCQSIEEATTFNLLVCLGCVHLVTTAGFLGDHILFKT